MTGFSSIAAINDCIKFLGHTFSQSTDFDARCRFSNHNKASTFDKTGYLTVNFSGNLANPQIPEVSCDPELMKGFNINQSVFNPTRHTFVFAKASATLTVTGPGFGFDLDFLGVMQN